MARTYSTISELYREVTEVKLIELAPHVLSVPENLLETLKPHRAGLYVPGFVEPAFVQGELYYVSPGNGGFESPVDFGHIQADRAGQGVIPAGDFYNAQRKFHLRRSMYERLKKIMRDYPAVPSQGFEAAVAVVIGYLNKLNRFTNVAARQYDLDKLVREEYFHLVGQEIFENAFDPLLTEVRNFVGTDQWNLYFVRVVGMTLVLEKGLDYRIVDWTRNQLMKTEGFDHDRGGVDDGYAHEWHTSSKAV